MRRHTILSLVAIGFYILLYSSSPSAQPNSNSTDPQFIPIPIGQGRPPRPERPERSKRESSSLPPLESNLIPSATVAPLPWSGTREIRILRVDRKGRIELVGNRSVILAEVAIPQPTRLGGREGKAGIVAVDYLQATLQNARVIIDIPTGTIPTNRPPWPSYVLTADGTLLLNAEMLRLGMARYVASPTETVYSSVLQQAENAARQAQIGIWEKPSSD